MTDHQLLATFATAWMITAVVSNKPLAHFFAVLSAIVLLIHSFAK